MAKPDDELNSAVVATAPTAAKTCPSRACEEGVALLGVMTPSGRLAYVHPSPIVDSTFVAKARSQGSPERRFRFSGPCVEGQCPQWTGVGCHIADVVVEEDGAREFTSSRLPACTIRPSCRWFFQSGAAACAACPTIVADMGGTQTHRTGAESDAQPHSGTH